MNEGPSRLDRGGDAALDRAIDRAVRDLMNVEPPAGLRRRVLNRLATPPRRSLLPRLAFAATAVIALVAAMVLFRPAQPSPAPADSRTAAANAATAPVQSPASVAPSIPAVAPERSARRAPVATPIPMPRITNVFGDRSTRATATAAAIEDVVFPPLADPGSVSEAVHSPAPIVVPVITIAPLEVQQIRVPPLSERKN